MSGTYSNIDFLKRCEEHRERKSEKVKAYLTESEIENLKKLEGAARNYLNKKKIVSYSASALSRDLKRWL